MTLSLTEDPASLRAQISVLRAALEANAETRDVAHALAVSASTSRTSALETLVARFHLGDFERAALVLAAGMELDEALRTHARQRLPTLDGMPTVSAAMMLAPSDCFLAFASNAPLRRHHLIEIVRGQSLARSGLRIDDRILQFLFGIDAGVDEHIEHLVTRAPEPDPRLEDAYGADATRVAAILGQNERAACAITGMDAPDRRAIAWFAARSSGLELFVIRVADLPRSAAERSLVLGLWTREAILRGAALLIEHDDASPVDTALAAWLDRAQTATIVSATSRASLGSCALPLIEARKPGAAAQRKLWLEVLAPDAPEARARSSLLVSQFDMGPARILAVASAFTEHGPDARVDGDDLFEGCRQQMRPRLESLADRIDARADWDALVLPQHTKELLAQIVAHTRQRAKVLETWGFGAQGSRGLGLAALFVGPSGTGKTMSAEVIARAVGLDLYRIDLSQVVSKYIGETEKNLARIFDAADDGSAVLLFDEADALFGKRTETKDSHDRYANIEVGYLLQRMESYKGLALLTTNFRSAIDKAFLRRFRFLVEFPFPDAALRAGIWRRMFPPETPTRDLDFAALAKLHVPGGNIRTIALNAAFLAADEDEPVCMRHVASAARAELAKLDLPVGEARLVEA